MTTVTWPAGAPQFAESWQQKSEPVTVRSSMDIGPPKVRRRYTRAMNKYQVGMIGTHAQGNAVQDFFDVECQGGVNFHTFLNPFTGVVETYRFLEAPDITNLSALAVQITMNWEKL